MFFLFCYFGCNYGIDFTIDQKRIQWSEWDFSFCGHWHNDIVYPSPRLYHTISWWECECYEFVWGVWKLKNVCVGWSLFTGWIPACLLSTNPPPVFIKEQVWGLCVCLSQQTCMRVFPQHVYVPPLCGKSWTTGFLKWFSFWKMTNQQKQQSKRRVMSLWQF